MYMHPAVLCLLFSYIVVKYPLVFFQTSLPYKYFVAVCQLKTVVCSDNVVHIYKIALVASEKSAVIKLFFNFAQLCVNCVPFAVTAMDYAL